MNQKLLPYIKDQGFCCLWAYLEANRAKLTSVLMSELDSVCTSRALRHHRADHRAGETKCEGLEKCLKKRIQEGHAVLIRKIP